MRKTGENRERRYIEQIEETKETEEEGGVWMNGVDRVNGMNDGMNERMGVNEE
jgi:hypothetical protein